MNDVCYICQTAGNLDLVAPCTKCRAQIHVKCLPKSLICDICQSSLAFTKRTKVNRTKCFNTFFAQVYPVFICCVSVAINVFISIGMNADYADEKVQFMGILVMFLNIFEMIPIGYYIGSNLKNYYNLSMLPFILLTMDIFLHVIGYLTVRYVWGIADVFTCRTYLAGVVAIIILGIFIIMCGCIVGLLIDWYTYLIDSSLETELILESKKE